MLCLSQNVSKGATFNVVWVAPFRVSQPLIELLVCWWANLQPHTLLCNQFHLATASNRKATTLQLVGKYTIFPNCHGNQGLPDWSLGLVYWSLATDFPATANNYPATTHNQSGNINISLATSGCQTVANWSQGLRDSGLHWLCNCVQGS